MKRIQMTKKVNRNNNSFNHLNRKVNHINTVNPEFLVGQIWLQEDEPTAVEIIELNTSDELDPLPDDALDNRLDDAWSYTKKETLQQIQDNYKINQKARERRRQNYEKHFLSTNTATNTKNQFSNNNLYSDVVGSHYIEDNQLINHQVNCFTIINKHFVNSDTSSDTDVEIIASNDILIEPTNWDAVKPYDEEIITYDPELDKETRTIWIYSFKNKHLLTENDYEFGNTAAKEMSSSTSVSVDSDEEKTKDKSISVRRLGSPIPPTYIPRLNLSLGPTLSTVTEVSEPNKQASSNSSHKSPKNRFQKPRNSWFTNDSEKLDSARSVRKLEKSTNIVNWMSLSPREKRRRSKEQGDIWKGSFLKLETLAAEELVQKDQQQTQDTSEQNSIRLQVDVDVHVSVHDQSPGKRSLGTPTRKDVIVRTNTDSINSTFTKSPEMDRTAGALDRGDHDMKLEQPQKIMCGTSHICESMQRAGHAHRLANLQNRGPLTASEEAKIGRVASSREEKEETETASYDYLTDKLHLAVENADRLWMKKNAPFLRPSNHGSNGS
uniref:Uncharacterized protein n=1 Tax=Heliothis virescens TaxID=7102 RepID=A0A2A4JYM4_HELVI